MSDIRDHENRKTDFEILPEILLRWSPRAMTGGEIPRDDLMAMFEAARFAQSCYNEQPWRFVYAMGGTEDFAKFENILAEFNWNWAKDASVLMIAIAKEMFARNDKPNAHHAFDTGTAWGFLSLEATRRGYVTHGMGGFSRDAAREILGIPDGYVPIAAIAIGILAERDSLPDELKEKEEPGQRRPLSESFSEGKFNF